MYSLISTPLCNFGVSKFPLPTSFNFSYNNNPRFLSCRKALQIHANAANEVDRQIETVQEEPKEENLEAEPQNESNNISSTSSPSTAPLDKDLKKVGFWRMVYLYMENWLILELQADFEDVHIL